MVKTFEAVYQDGVIKPLKKVDLPENKRLKVTVEVTEKETIPTQERVFVKITAVEEPSARPASLYGAFPELLQVTDEDLQAAKRIWEEGLGKQQKTIEE